MTSQLQRGDAEEGLRFLPGELGGEGNWHPLKLCTPFGVYCASPKARAGKALETLADGAAGHSAGLTKGFVFILHVLGNPVVPVFQQAFQSNWNWSEKCTNTIFRETFHCAKVTHPNLAKPPARKKGKKEQHGKGTWGAISSRLHVDNFNTRDMSTFLRLRVYPSQMPRLNILIVLILLSVDNL